MATASCGKLVKIEVEEVFRGTVVHCIDMRKKTYTKVIVSIDMKVIMSIDTINVVYIDMKKKKLT